MPRTHSIPLFKITASFLTRTIRVIEKNNSNGKKLDIVVIIITTRMMITTITITRTARILVVKAKNQCFDS
jgi:hypothetical protein